MKTPVPTPSSLADFVDLPDLLQMGGMSHIFPTLYSLRWFVRNHRDELAEQGALIMVAGRLRFHPALFQRVALAIGRRAVVR